jgi:hypothetical protein
LPIAAVFRWLQFRRGRRAISVPSSHFEHDTSRNPLPKLEGLIVPHNTLDRNGTSHETVQADGSRDEDGPEQKPFNERKCGLLLLASRHNE